MKKLYLCAFSVFAVSWITAISFLFILPAEMPMHLNPNAAGGVDRFGSKFECLLFPFAVTLVGALFLLTAQNLAARNSRKKGDASSEKSFILSSLPAMAIFFFIGILCMIGGMG